MAVLNESLTVLSTRSQGASVVLREALRFKRRTGSLVIQDATGRGAAILSQTNKLAADGKRMVWIDLADRRHPVSLFQLGRSPHLKACWAQTLTLIRGVAGAAVSDDVIRWASEAAWSLSRDGSAGLGALIRCLGSAETRRWFLDSGNPPSELGKLLDLLGWALAYPAVHAISEGNNRGDLLRALEKPSVVWLESAIDHFEPVEYLLVQILAEAALTDALTTMTEQREKWGETQRGLTVVHLHPVSSVTRPLEEWVGSHLGIVRHVAVHHLEPDEALAPEVILRARRSEFLWVAGAAAGFKGACHKEWLDDSEQNRVAELKDNELWVRSNQSGKSQTVRVRDCEIDPGPADRIRMRAALRRRITPIPQAAASAGALGAPHAQRDLYQRLQDPAGLRAGWLRVRESRTQTTGIDGITIRRFGESAENELRLLGEELTAGRYRPRPLRRIQIAKADGGVRNLGVSCVRDRVVQSACLNLIEPLFEPGFSRFSFGFRPGRGAHHAVAATRAMLASGRTWVVIADIRKCFDSIDHQVLTGLLAQRIADDEMLALIRQFLTIEVVEFEDQLPTEVGVPQGESISPLLANVYLDPLDKHFERLGLPFVRYADDFVILVTGETAAQEALVSLGDFLRESLRLELKPAKTTYVSAAEGFDFLGFRITDKQITIREDRAQTFLEHIGKEVKGLAAASGLQETGECLNRINSVIRGWRNYFSFGGEAAMAAQLRGLDERIGEAGRFHLPEALRENPVWQFRERLAFAPAAHGREPGVGRSSVPEPSDYPGDHVPDEEAPREEAPPDHSSAASDLGRAERGQRVKTRLSDTDTGSGSACIAADDGDRIYVLTHGTWVTASRGDIVLRKSGREILRRPIEKTGLVYLQGFGVSMSIDLQVKLAESDIPVVLAQPFGTPAAVVSPVVTARSSVRRLQAVRRDEPNIVKVGLKMVAAKIANQAAVLKYFGKYRNLTAPETGMAMTSSAGRILELAKKVAELNESEASVRPAAMGFEGHAAAIYWQQLSALVPKELGFSGRMTMQAQDPVNQSINYVYGLLYGEVWRAVVQAGLDPYFGVMHGSDRDRGSLVFDLIEEFRAPFGDRVVMSLLGRGFHPAPGSRGFLKTRCRRVLIAGFMKRWNKPLKYRSQSITPSDVLKGQARKLAAMFRDGGKYQPYRMRW